MPFHYILDGYNILKQLPEILHKKIKGGRSGFILTVSTARRLLKQDITIFFDGFPEEGERNPDLRIKVVFSREISADEKIRRYLAKSQDNQRKIVVSDDREVRFFSKNAGAKTLSVAEFCEFLKDRDIEEKEPDEKNVLGYKQIIDINRELKKRWLGE